MRSPPGRGAPNAGRSHLPFLRCPLRPSFGEAGGPSRQCGRGSADRAFASAAHLLGTSGDQEEGTGGWRIVHARSVNKAGPPRPLGSKVPLGRPRRRALAEPRRTISRWLGWRALREPPRSGPGAVRQRCRPSGGRRRGAGAGPRLPRPCSRPSGRSWSLEQVRRASRCCGTRIAGRGSPSTRSGGASTSG